MEAWGADTLSDSATDGDDVTRQGAALQLPAAPAAPLAADVTAPPPDALVVDLTLHRELRAEAQALQKELNDRKTERLIKHTKFEQLQMSLQVIACEKAPTTATEVRDNPLSAGGHFSRHFPPWLFSHTCCRWPHHADR
jgi:hypothetical protein